MQTFRTSLRPLLVVAVVLAVTVPSVRPARAQALRRDIESYFLLATQKAKLKDLRVSGPCNVGVDCAPRPQAGSCGKMSMRDVTFAEGSQVVADQMFFRKLGASVWQVFRNGGGSLSNVVINAPPEMPWDPPILPGTCDEQCVVDVAAFEAVCGFPDPFPSCDPGNPITVLPGGECPGDVQPGNGECDLPPGTYGAVTVRNRAVLNLGAGDYVVCSFKAGRNARVLAPASRLLVADHGSFRANNSSVIAQRCGELSVLVKGHGRVSFGRNLQASAFVCAPESRVRLGHNNKLKGQFIGEIVTADSNNEGQCCGGRCTCVDSFSPVSASVGQIVTLESACDLRLVSEVRICGLVASIVSQTPAKLTVEVPNGAAGQCTIEADSAGGTFTLAQALAVS